MDIASTNFTRAKSNTATGQRIECNYMVDCNINENNQFSLIPDSGLPSFHRYEIYQVNVNNYFRPNSVMNARTSIVRIVYVPTLFFLLPVNLSSFFHKRGQNWFFSASTFEISILKDFIFSHFIFLAATLRLHINGGN